MKALRCGCGRRLEAEDDGELLGRVLAHMRTTHSEVSLGEERVRGFVAHAYEFEYAQIYAGTGTIGGVWSRTLLGGAAVRG